MGLTGINAYKVEVEAFVAQGMPGFDVVGLPGDAVRESRDRVRAAIKTCGFNYPVSRITVNMAPADVRKNGAIYDVPLLLAVLASSGQLPAISPDAVFLGELSLNGQLRRIKGALSMAIAARDEGLPEFFIPAENAAEASVVEGIKCYPVDNIKQLISHLCDVKKIKPVKGSDYVQSAPLQQYAMDYAEVKGQEAAKRAIEIACAGGHNILMIGSPGAGKSMLAKRMPSILPDMTFEEKIQVTKIHSVAGALPPDRPLITERPFRSPHHNASAAALSGGGRIPIPGEVSLAHNGVLFLDELPEFSAMTMEVLRQPLEDGAVTVSRAAGRVTYPCAFQLVAAMNPCRCGYFGHPSKPCSCSRDSVRRYLAKISGPLLDRIDLHVEVPPVDFDHLVSNELPSSGRCRSSDEMRAAVNAARRLAQGRFEGAGITCNARITPDKLREVCVMTEDAAKLLGTAFDKLQLSARAYERILKISRTIADLDGSEKIENAHIAEAIQYRSLDRKYWQ
ncbi:MAG: YifB family Mg chelatase-like AAA ATPase [Oscillospiraceae bacterium]|nr:YifB family Mg chelatase-like AAA ATPase [Oscillospiraceae bacterium]